jgi:phage shock protein E
MIDTLKRLFGFGEKPDYAALIHAGATIVDVRTPSEFASGHVVGSVNIPLDSLGSKVAAIPQGKPVVTCCASGMRSAAAASALRAKGYQEVYNGGSWASLNRYVK